MVLQLLRLPAPKGSGDPVRMRNIFAAPLEYVKENLEELKDMVFPKNEEQKEFLSHAFENHFVFQHISDKEKKQLIDAMVLKSVDKGTTIIHQGQKGEHLYVIEEGTVQFLVDGSDVGQGQKGTIFGELSLLYDCPTAASVVAETDCKLWRVSQFTFRRIKAAHVLHSDEEGRSAITSIPFFKDLPDEYIFKLADSLFEKSFKQGEVLAKKGEEGTTLFILKKGWVQGTDISIGTTQYADVRLGPGDYFGERPIVTGEPTPGNATALSDGVAFIMTKERFQRTVGHLKLENLILKAHQKKVLMAVPLFAYSDVDAVEFELLASKMEDVEYKKGDAVARKGDSVVPALYIVRSGEIALSNGSDSKHLTAGEVFGFGGETLIQTNALKQQDTTGIAALIKQAAVYLFETGLKADSVVAMHDATVTEGVKLGMLTLKSIAEVLHDPLRLGRSGSAQDETVTTETLEKRKVLGAGTFGTVWLTRQATTGAPYALKVQYKRDLIEFGQATGVIREKNVMARMHHPFVMSIVNSQQDETCLYMMMDLLQGGELGSVMRKILPEKYARFYAAGILEGLSYMHRRLYVYRDLKGENVLLDNDGYAVIVDLGFAKFVPDKTFTFCGTPLFIAPEVILSKGHDKSADLWSYGVLLYQMLTGETPFYDGKIDQMALFKKIVKGKWTFPESCNASPNARDLIEKILVVDPKNRLGCLSRADLDVRDHAWFGGFDFGALYRKEITPPWTPAISNPFDGSNFADWSGSENEKKDLKPLSEEEQQLFEKF